MEQYEKVERIAKQTGVTFEEAKHALEACNWDMLDATILLEKQNKGVKKQVFSTDYEAQPGYKNVAASSEINNGSAGNSCRSKDFGEKVKEFFKKSHINHLVIRHNDKVIVSIPLWAAALIAVCMFKLTIVLLVISLICGCKLTFEGPDKQKMESVNKAVNTAGQAMNGAAAAFKSSFDASYGSKKTEGGINPTSSTTYTATVEINRTAAKTPAAEETATEAPATEAAEEANTQEEQPEQLAQEEQPMQTAEEFEKEDFSAIAEGFAANSVTTEDGKITLEL